MAAPAGKGCVSNEDTLFQERSLCSITANTRQVGEEFLALAARVAIRMDIVSYPMSDALCALSELAHGRFSGSAVLYAASRLRSANIYR